MQAMVLHAPQPVAMELLQLDEIARPVPGQGELLLKVLACGVCHTDLHTVEGELGLPLLPLVPGHQIVGTVAALGPGVTRFAVGDRVGVGWLHSTCGQCDFCRRGEENLCPQARFTGWHVDGGYAEYALVGQDYAFSLPAGLSDIAEAPLLCGGIIGYRSLRLSEIQPGGRLGLYGFGASAHLAIQVALHWGCEVYVFSRGDEHRQLAQTLGAAWTGLVEEDPPQKLDASIIFAPAGWMVPLALQHLRPGGTLAINAIHMSAIPEMPYARIYGERTLRSVANYTRRDAVEFLELAARIPVRAEVEVFPLAEANQALQRLKRRELTASGVLRISD